MDCCREESEDEESLHSTLSSLLSFPCLSARLHASMLSFLIIIMPLSVSVFQFACHCLSVSVFDLLSLSLHDLQGKLTFLLV